MACEGVSPETENPKKQHSPQSPPGTAPPPSPPTMPRMLQALRACGMGRVPAWVSEDPDLVLNRPFSGSQFGLDDLEGLVLPWTT